MVGWLLFMRDIQAKSGMVGNCAYQSQLSKWKSYFKWDVGMSHHEKEGEQKDNLTNPYCRLVSWTVLATDDSELDSQLLLTHQ